MALSPLGFEVERNGAKAHRASRTTRKWSAACWRYPATSGGDMGRAVLKLVPFVDETDAFSEVRFLAAVFSSPDEFISLCKAICKNSETVC